MATPARPVHPLLEKTRRSADLYEEADPLDAGRDYSQHQALPPLSRLYAFGFRGMVV